MDQLSSQSTSHGSYAGSPQLELQNVPKYSQTCSSTKYVVTAISILKDRLHVNCKALRNIFSETLKTDVLKKNGTKYKFRHHCMATRYSE